MDIGKRAVRRLGKRIREIREQKRWTQDDLAAAVDVEQSYVSRVERGVLSPSFPRIVLLAEALDVTVSELCKTV